MDARAEAAPNRLLRYAIAACSALVVIALASNRGYFSHDELQWLALADSDGWPHVPWAGFAAIDTFQYRPITFHLWLALLHVLGYRPMAVHAVIALIGLANALLMRACALRLGATRASAGVAMLVFLLFPYVMYVHGWVGTIADLLVCACASLAVLWLCRDTQDASALRGGVRDAIPIAVLTAIALLGKESAVVLPALLLCAWPRRRWRLVAPVAASAFVVLVYLLLRAKTILFSPHEPGVYTWSLGNIPGNLALFALFPFDLRHFEILGSRYLHGFALLVPIACVVLVFAAIATAGWRWLAGLVVGCVACLGPVLILDSVSNVYAYLASAFACGLIAIAAPRMRLAARWLLVAPALIAAVHGVQIGRTMRHIGSQQHHLYSDLVRLLPAASAEHPLRTRAMHEADDTAIRRLLYRVPSYRRIPLMERAWAVAYDDTTQTPTHWMKPSGKLMPALPSASGHAQP